VKRFDAETKTHYNYFRDYDPATGRYLTSDPIGLLAGPNTFAYVGARIPSQHLPNQPNFTQPGQVPTAPAANDPSHGANSITSGILRRIWSRAGPLGALTLLSYEAGRYVGSRIEIHFLLPSAVNSLIEEIRLYDPNFVTDGIQETWGHVNALGNYLRNLSQIYQNLYTHACDANFNPNLFDSELYFQSLSQIFPNQLPGVFGISTYTLPYEDQFPTREAYDQAIIEYATYLANGGTLAFLDWLARVYRGTEGGGVGNSGDGRGADPHGIYAAFTTFQQEGGEDEFHDWWETGATQEFTSDQLREYGEQLDWYSPEDSAEILVPPSRSHLYNGPDLSSFNHDQIEQLTSHPNAHTLDRHGADVTREDRLIRAHTGESRDGSDNGSIPEFSSSFDSDSQLIRALEATEPGSAEFERQIEITFGDSQDSINEFDRLTVFVDTGNHFGRGIPESGTEDILLDGALARYEFRNGSWKLVTMFPSNRPGDYE